MQNDLLKKRADTTTPTSPELAPVSFVKEKAVQDPKYLLIQVDTNKLDAAWSLDDGFYIPRDGKSAIGDRRERFSQWLKDNPNTPIESPYVYWNDHLQCVGFSNGRHRFSVLRDMGYPTVGVVIAKEQLEYFKPMMAASKTAATLDQYLWTEYHPDSSTIICAKTNLLHTEWFESMELPSWGNDYDKVPRGVIRVNRKNKTAVIQSYHPQWAPRSVWNFFEARLKGYILTEGIYDKDEDTRFGTPVKVYDALTRRNKRRVNSSVSYPPELKGLAAEARKCPDFEEFERDFLAQIKHGQYWHITRDPNFVIDPAKGPRDMSSMADNTQQPGDLMVTSHLEWWDGHYNFNNDDEEEITRPYAALIDMSQVPREDYGQSNRGFGNEFWVSPANQAKVIGVYPIQEARTMAREYADTMTRYVNSSGALMRFYEWATGKKAEVKKEDLFERCASCGCPVPAHKQEGICINAPVKYGGGCGCTGLKRKTASYDELDSFLHEAAKITGVKVLPRGSPPSTIDSWFLMPDGRWLVGGGFESPGHPGLAKAVGTQELLSFNPVRVVGEHEFDFLGEPSDNQRMEIVRISGGIRENVTWDFREDWGKRKRISSGRGTVGDMLRGLDSMYRHKTAAVEVDMNLINSIVTEFMTVLKPGLPKPEIKISNGQSSILGECLWKYGKREGVDYCGDSTVITIQRRVCGDERTLRRILAHELAHHEDSLVNDKKDFEEKGFDKFVAYRKMFRPDSHGAKWLAIAARFNTKFGKDFVTNKSDQIYVSDSTDLKPCYVLIEKYYNGSLMWQVANRLSPKARKYLGEVADNVLKSSYEHKLFMSTDPILIRRGAPLIQFNGWAVGSKNPGAQERLEDLWNNGTDILQQFKPEPKVEEDEMAKVHRLHEETYERLNRNKSGSAYYPKYNANKNARFVYHGTTEDRVQSILRTGVEARRENEWHYENEPVAYATADKFEAINHVFEKLDDEPGKQPNIAVVIIDTRKVEGYDTQERNADYRVFRKGVPKEAITAVEIYSFKQIKDYWDVRFPLTIQFKSAPPLPMPKKVIKTANWKSPLLDGKVADSDTPTKTQWETLMETEEHKDLSQAYTRELNDSWVEYVPIAQLLPLQEYDWSENYNRNGRDTFLDLVEDIKRHGVRSPITLRYFKDTSTALIIEGNHRVAAAKAAGLTEVPARVTIASYPRKEYGSDIGGLKGGKVRGLLNPDEDIYYDYIKPSDIGLAGRKGTAKTGASTVAVTDELRDAKFNELASAQRGAPEKAMRKCQGDNHPLGSGVGTSCLEHVGDLTHRMSQNFTYLEGQYGTVKDKVEKSLFWLMDDIEQVMEEQMRSNYDYYVRNYPEKAQATSYEELKAEFFKLWDAYAEAHANLKVFNYPQRLAKFAAYDLGKRNFSGAISNLKKLKSLLDQGQDMYKEMAGQFNPKNVTASQRIPGLQEVLNYGGSSILEISDWAVVGPEAKRRAGGEESWDKLDEKAQEALELRVAHAQIFQQYFAAKQRLNSLQFPLTVYRAVGEPTIEEVQENWHSHGGFGECWTDSETESAYINKERGSEHILFKGILTSPSDIDWLATAFTNTVAMDELEIKLKLGAKVQIVGWKKRGETEWQTPPDRLKMVTASFDKEASLAAILKGLGAALLSGALGTALLANHPTPTNPQDKELNQVGHKMINKLPKSILNKVGDPNTITFKEGVPADFEQGDAICQVAKGSRVIYINPHYVEDFLHTDSADQLTAHETTHIMQSEIDPKGTRFPKTDEANPYGAMSDAGTIVQTLQKLRAKGDRMWNHSREEQAMIVQQYEAMTDVRDNTTDPAQKKGVERNLKVLGEYIKDYDQLKVGSTTTTLYHGTPILSAYQSIKNEGLKATDTGAKYQGNKGFAPLPGAYLTKDFGNAVRYSFMSNSDYAESIKQEPNGYVFEFNSADLSDTTPDEDEVGMYIVPLILANKVPPDLQPAVDSIPSNLRAKITSSPDSFEVFALVGKHLLNSNLLSKESLGQLMEKGNNVVNYGVIHPTAVWVIPKPTKQFLRDEQGTFKTTGGYVNYVKQFGKGRQKLASPKNSITAKHLKSIIAGLNNADSMGMFIVEEATIPDYEVYLVQAKDDPNWVELAIQQVGQDASVVETQNEKVAPNIIAKDRLKVIITGWLQKYLVIHVMSYNPEYLKKYVRMLRRAGFRVNREDELVEGKEAFRITAGGDATMYQTVGKVGSQVTASWGDPNAKQIAVLKQIEPRSGSAFKTWLKEYIGGDTDPDYEEVLQIETLRLGYLMDWLQEEHSIEVNEDGYCTFWRLDSTVERLIGDLPVILYHYTSSAVLPKIRREGLRSDVKRVNPDGNSGSGVYLTPEKGGAAVEGYCRVSLNGHGSRERNHSVGLEVKTYLRNLQPDTDDEDIESGAYQYTLPYVAPKDIIFPGDDTPDGGKFKSPLLASHKQTPLRFEKREHLAFDSNGARYPESYYVVTDGEHEIEISVQNAASFRVKGSRSERELWWLTLDEDGNILKQGTAYGVVPPEAIVDWVREHGREIAVKSKFLLEEEQEPLYIRFGNLPKGLSMNHATGLHEKGVSVYSAHRVPTGGYELSEDGTLAGAAIKAALGGYGHKTYLVKGTLVGRGSDNEPLLNNPKVVSKLTYRDGAYFPEKFKSPLLASHKQTPMSDTTFPNMDSTDGEGSNAYSLQPEKVEGTYNEPDVETMLGGKPADAPAPFPSLKAASSDNLSRAEEFFVRKWSERAIELGRPEPTDLRGACKFASLFVQALFGGEIRGNQNHQYNVLPDGRHVDLTGHHDPKDYEHDEEFWGNPEHVESLEYCKPRVQKWVAEFRGTKTAVEKPKLKGKKPCPITEDGWLLPDGTFLSNRENGYPETTPSIDTLMGGKPKGTPSSAPSLKAASSTKGDLLNKSVTAAQGDRNAVVPGINTEAPALHTEPLFDEEKSAGAANQIKGSGWLTPEGVFHEADYASHASVARLLGLAPALNEDEDVGDAEAYYTSNDDACTAALQKGCIRIIGNEFEGWEDDSTTRFLLADAIQRTNYSTVSIEFNHKEGGWGDRIWEQGISRQVALDWMWSGTLPGDKTAATHGEDKTAGQVYLMHLDKQGQPGHKVGWAMDAQDAIEQHYASTTKVAVVNALNPTKVTFTVAKVWDNVGQEFETKLKQGNLKDHCPICTPKIGVTGEVKGMIRLYRGLEQPLNENFDLTKTDAPTGYSTWTDNPELAKEYAGTNGYVYQIDLPESELGEDMVNEDGDRPLFLNSGKPVGLHGVSGEEYLVYHYHDQFSPSLIKPKTGSGANLMEVPAREVRKGDMIVTKRIRFIVEQNIREGDECVIMGKKLGQVLRYSLQDRVSIKSREMK